MNKCVYTCITNGYDSLKEPLKVTKGWDYVAFTDDSSLKSSIWDVRYIKKAKDPIRQQRKIKCLPHKFLPEYDRTFWIDGSYSLVRDLSLLMDNYEDAVWVAKLHPARKNIMQEAVAVMKAAKDADDVVMAQMDAYGPAIKGLWETGLMIRNNTPAVNKVCEDWYEEIVKHSHRDQLSLPYVFAKNRFKPTDIRPKVIESYFSRAKHKKKDKAFNVYYFVPGRGDKNIGKGINDHCALVPGEDDWICVRDGDSMFMNPFWPKQIEDIIKRNSDRFDIIGCVTNRLASEGQRPWPEDFDNLDILYHKGRVDQLVEEKYNEVVPHDAPIAGLLMLFKKSVWDKVKFREKSIYADTKFCEDATRKGFKVGLATGLYVFHYYRAHITNAKKYKEHLL